jgi:hypothetical protein
MSATPFPLPRPLPGVSVLYFFPSSVEFVVVKSGGGRGLFFEKGGGDKTAEGKKGRGNISCISGG